VSRKRTKRWSHGVGTRGQRVVVYERKAGGTLYARVHDPSLAGGKGGYRRVSLGHSDRDLAARYALEQATKLREGLDDLRSGRTSLAQLFAAYRRHRTPRKTSAQQREDDRRMELWVRVLGAQSDPHQVSMGQWEAFLDDRLSGAIDSRGQRVTAEYRRKVRLRAVEGDLKWLRWCLNWGMRWRDGSGRYLLRENPVRGYEMPTEPNPRRPVATEDRYEALRAVSDAIRMEIRWLDKRVIQRSYLSELLDIANGTGRRISAICQLRFDDLKLGVGPYGSIRWPAATDKEGIEVTVPVTPGVRAALDRILRERPGVGRTPLFPSPTDPATPIDKNRATVWLLKAEQLADVPKMDGSLWHAFRRKWVTERKHLPDVDVAAAGGWRGTECLRRNYQQPDDATILEVVMAGGHLRERKA
jgi:hypothetical protein